MAALKNKVGSMLHNTTGTRRGSTVDLVLAM